MNEILQKKIMQIFLSKSRKISIMTLVFGGLIIASNIYAKDLFDVELKCKGNDQEYCDIVKNSNNKTTFILRDMRYPQVDKVNENIFHAYGSCGSPCQYHFFISKIKQDQTKEFIIINKKNNCLIESDSKHNVIYARRLFSKNKKIIANLKNKEFHNVPIDIAIYNSFQEKSYFDNKGKLHLVAMLADVDKNGNSLYFDKIVDETCE
ncbi:hypothetical protein ACX1N0_06260 [Acinetobacter sp. ANC 4635]|uniref:hypothetical protein n=1 Tax=Acinetobacter sp. ANC 4635 TaxID=2529846 RepID=UPI001D1974F7|nr:hypothetical protein [Acinetobacter sp. ANC 4635]